MDFFESAVFLMPALCQLFYASFLISCECMFYFTFIMLISVMASGKPAWFFMCMFYLRSITHKAKIHKRAILVLLGHAYYVGNLSNKKLCCEISWSKLHYFIQYCSNKNAHRVWFKWNNSRRYSGRVITVILVENMGTM